MLEVEDGGHFCCVTHREVVVPAIQHFMQTNFPGSISANQIYYTYCYPQIYCVYLELEYT